MVFDGSIHTLTQTTIEMRQRYRHVEHTTVSFGGVITKGSFVWTYSDDDVITVSRILLFSTHSSVYSQSFFLIPAADP